MTTRRTRCISVVWPSAVVWFTACSSNPFVNCLHAVEQPASISFSENPWHFARVPLHLKDGAPLLFELDTGAPGTAFDKSLEPSLGVRLGDQRSQFPFAADPINEGEYKAPNLFIGKTRLATARTVVTMQLQQILGPNVQGILGMDCLKHYCIQLDFSSRKLNFLNPDHTENGGLGRSFLFSLVGEGAKPVMEADILGQGAAKLIIDTGCSADLVLPPPLFRRAVGDFKPERVTHVATSPGKECDLAVFQSLKIFGDTHTNVMVLENSIQPKLEVGCLGIGFLRHYVVTLNFPRRIMYLKPIGSGS